MRYAFVYTFNSSYEQALNKLYEGVNNYIERGFRPQGGIEITPAIPTDEFYPGYYMTQALVMGYAEAIPAYEVMPPV